MPESHRRTGSRVLAVLLATLTAFSVVGPADAGITAARSSYPRAIEGLTGYASQSTCSPAAKPGVADFSKRLLRAYPGTRSLGIVRACRIGGKSEHKEGRAFDWGVNAKTASGRAKVESFKTWLLKTDKYGNKYAMARRTGIMYVIWNKRIWSASRPTVWRTYTGSNPHTDHVHISFGWKGARKNTSFWTGKGGVVTPPPAKPAPKPTVPPTGPATPKAEPRPATSLPAGPVLQDETVRLLANKSTGVTTTGSLTKGENYVLEVAGKYKYGTGTYANADAECSRSTAASTWQRNRSVHKKSPNADHLDLYVDGVDLGSSADRDAGDGCDTATHTYRQTFTPSRTGRVTFKVWEPGYYSDNSGSLVIRVLRPTPKDELHFSVPANAGAGVLSPGSLVAGATYVATVTGAVNAGNGVNADAECSATASDTTWRRNRSVTPGATDRDDLDLLLDRNDVGLDPVVPDGSTQCDTTGHSYRMTLRPQQTRPVNLRVDDPSPTDNKGALAVSLVRVKAPTGTESVTLDATEEDGVSSARVYQAGQRLRVTATGTYTFRSGVTADAECSVTSTDPTWRNFRDSLVDDRGNALGDVKVNNRVLDWRPVSGSGSCDAAGHRYALELTQSQTGPVRLTLADTRFWDNAGTVALTVTPVNGS